MTVALPSDRFTTETRIAGRKLVDITWGLLFLLAATAGLGFLTLYSAAGGDLRPWALPQMMRFGAGLLLFLAIAMVDIRHIHRFAYVIYAVVLAMLVAIEILSINETGVQRWIHITLPGVQFQFQPSELMKFAVVLALARYFHGLALNVARRWTSLPVPLILIALPSVLVVRQPDLGTGLLMAAGGIVLMFLAGVRKRWFLGGFASALGMAPVVWYALLPYQRDRVMAFLSPSRDPLGTGYHIQQSKIALGSGGVWGKGFLKGTQSQLNFLPEKHTDFIFTMLAEEWGLVGALGLIILYCFIVLYGVGIALRSGSQFGRLLALGIISAFFLYVVANIAMVTGLIPIVGVPLPFISFGGTAMITLMMAFGILASVYVHRDTEVPRHTVGLI